MARYETINKIIGRFSNVFLIPRMKAKISSRSEYDKTGMLTVNGKVPKMFWCEQGVIYVDYESLAHSLWRAQELTLFNKFRHLIKEPILDFGCGDGSFSSILFKEIHYGVDVDPDALKEARSKNIYKNLLLTDNLHELESQSVRTIICNSVLEHVGNLNHIIFQFNRILGTDGLLIFTVPTINYTDHVIKYFGKHTATLVNKESTHLNMFKHDQWINMMEAIAFRVEKSILYQSEEYTFAYMISRFFGKRGLGRFSDRVKYALLNLYKGRILDAIDSSVNGVENGANLFLITRKHHSIPAPSI